MSEPLYKIIYSDLKKSILNSTYPIGSQIPTDKELTEIYEVSTITIKKAMELLKKDGLISRKPRKGTLVISNKIKLSSTNQIDNSLPLIGLILTDFNDYFGTDVLKNIIEYSFGKAQVLFKLSSGDSELEEKMVNELLSLNVDGIILLPASSEYISPRILELVSTNFPIVLIDRFMEKIPTCSVQINNRKASEKLVEYLFDHGHERVAIITPDNHITTLEDRINGAISSHVKNHVSINQSQILTDLHSMIPNSQTQPREDIDKIKDFLKREKDITAIFAGEYAIAVLAEHAIKELGRQITLDYSIVCFDHPKNNYLHQEKYDFTHIRQDQEALGKNSVDLLLKKINHPTLVEKINVPFYLVEGASVRKLNKAP